MPRPWERPGATIQTTFDLSGRVVIPTIALEPSERMESPGARSLETRIPLSTVGVRIQHDSTMTSSIGLQSSCRWCFVHGFSGKAQRNGRGAPVRCAPHPLSFSTSGCSQRAAFRLSLAKRHDEGGIGLSNVLDPWLISVSCDARSKDGRRRNNLTARAALRHCWGPCCWGWTAYIGLGHVLPTEMARLIGVTSSVQALEVEAM